MSPQWYKKLLFVPNQALKQTETSDADSEIYMSSDEETDWVIPDVYLTPDDPWEEAGILERDLYLDPAPHDTDIEVHVSNDKHMPAEPLRRRRTELLPAKLDVMVQRTSRGVASTWRAAKNAPAFTQDALGGAISASMNAFEQTDVKDLNLLTTPLNVGLAAVGGASGIVARALAREANGAKDTRVVNIVDRAEAHFKAGLGFWTEPQERIAREWIAESRRLLEDFANNDYVGSEGQNAGSATGDLAHAKLVGDYFKLGQGESNNRNPSKLLLKSRAMELYCLIAALEKFCKIPYRVRQVSPQQVLATLEHFEKRGEFIGSQTHKDSLTSVALDSASNSTAAADKQVKYLPVSIDGPGTGKSTCAETMMKATGQAYIKISGEMIKSWTIPKEMSATAHAAQKAAAQNKGDDKSASPVQPSDKDDGKNPPKDICDLLMEEIKRRLCELDETNVFVLLDDLHIAWDKSTTNNSEGEAVVRGPFARDPQAFNKLMDVWKTCTDAAQDRVPGDEVELSPNPAHPRKFPVSFKRVQFFITGNQEHDAFNPQKPGSEWLMSRLRRMGSSYMTADDRLRTCLVDWRGKINAIIANHYQWTVQSKDGFARVPDLERVEANIDQALAKQTLEKIARLDIEVATGRFGGENGHRGLIFFLKNFEGYIARQLNLLGRDEINPRVYSLQGTPPYDMQTVMAGISDYNKARDQQLVDQKDQEDFKRAIATLRLRANTLGGDHLERLTERIASAERQTSMADKKASQQAAEFLLNWYSGRVKPPRLLDLMRRIDDEFKDTKAGETSDDIDGFRPLKNFVVGLLARKKMTDDGDYGKSLNRIVRVRLAHPSADDQGFFEKLGAMLGGITVKSVDADGFLSTPVPLPHFDHNEFTSDTTLKERYDTVSENVRYNHNIFTINGNRTRVAVREFKSASRSYFYVAQKGDDEETAYYFFEPAHIDCVHSGREIDGSNTSLFKFVRSKLSLGQIVAEHENPRLAFLDPFANNTSAAQLAGEAYLVVRLTSDVMVRVRAWAQARSGGATLDPSAALKKLQEYLSGEILNRDCVIIDGHEIDPRAITLFLVDGADESNTPVAGNDDKIVTTITLGPPTLEGRGARAHSAIRRTLTQVVKEAYWKTPQAQLPAPALTQEEQEALDALVAFDRQQAKAMRDDKGELLSTALLEKIAIDFAKLLGERFTLDGLQREGLFDVADKDASESFFEGCEGLPSQRELLKNWAAEYRTEVMRVDAKLAAKAAEAERIERERRAAEERKKWSSGGGYGGEYGYRQGDAVSADVVKVTAPPS